jgi:hypothetical protein
MRKLLQVAPFLFIFVSIIPYAHAQRSEMNMTGSEMNMTGSEMNMTGSEMNMTGSEMNMTGSEMTTK